MPDDTTTADTGVRTAYVVTIGVALAGGMVLLFIVPPLPDVQLEPVDGIGAFAILYVLAQAIERLSQLIVPILDRLVGAAAGGSASARKVAALNQLRLKQWKVEAGGDSATEFVGTLGDNNANDDQQTVTSANIEKALLTNSVAFIFAVVAVSLFNFLLLDSIGFVNVPEWLDRLVTATAIMGGSAGLADLISKVQKSKTASEVNQK